MKVARNWNEIPELFEAVADALDGNVTAIDEDTGDDIDVDVDARDEGGDYGEGGYIDLKYGGKHFRLELTEIV